METPEATLIESAKALCASYLASVKRIKLFGEMSRFIDSEDPEFVSLITLESQVAAKCILAIQSLREALGDENWFTLQILSPELKSMDDDIASVQFLRCCEKSGLPLPEVNHSSLQFLWEKIQ